MKNLYKFACAVALTATMTGCADYIDTDNFVVEKPQDIANAEELNQYDALKTYINRANHPKFKLGIALGVDDYLKYGTVYNLANANFDMMTAGNAMKYASCVDDKGNMDFSKVYNFVEAAKQANMQIYGHTLAWHSQQRPVYLNSLIADKEMDVDPDAKVEKEDAMFDYSTMGSYEYWHQKPDGANISIENGELVIDNPVAISNFWELQYFVADGFTLPKDVDYKITALIKADSDVSVNVVFGGWSNNNSGKLNVTSEWEEKSVTINNAEEGTGHIMFQSGDYAGKIRMKWLKITHSEAPVFTIFKNYLSNGDAEGSDVSCFKSTEVNNNGGPKDCVIADGKGVDGSRAFVVTSSDAPANTWDNQFFIRCPQTFAAGDKFKVAFDYRADHAAKGSTQAHGEPGSYMHWSMIGDVNFTPEWKHFEKEITVSTEQDGMRTIAFNLSEDATANTYYFDNVQWGVEVSANTIPLTPEEKKEVLTKALEDFIKGMFATTGDYVKEWDLANETVAGGGDDGEGFYPLQSMEASGDPANFFWQDYLGSVDYVVIAEKAARAAFAENGGNPEDLKLFINDYNLESWWDGNKKARSLVHWIQKWEAAGAKIDGIGTQMHISYILNENDQKAQEKSIQEMFKILAATGKLVRITELDMGITERAFGDAILTENVTSEQQVKMAEFYQWVIEQYYALVPADQQDGITQWCATDSPADSGWRGGSPVGLWTLDYMRKPQYAGFANGLKE